METWETIQHYTCTFIAVLHSTVTVGSSTMRTKHTLNECVICVGRYFLLPSIVNNPCELNTAINWLFIECLFIRFISVYHHFHQFTSFIVTIMLIMGWTSRQLKPSLEMGFGSRTKIHCVRIVIRSQRP
jgi:hypothetical protein